MWVIGPMVIYLCERLVRFIRYMQRVTYRKVRLITVRQLAELLSGEVLKVTKSLCFTRSRS